MNTISSYLVWPGLIKPKAINFEQYKQDKIKYIQQAACEYFGETPIGIKLRCRERNKVLTRQVIMYLLKNNTQLTLKAIGEIYGMDHTTVLYSCKAIRVTMENDQMIKHAVKQLESLIES